MKHPMLVRWGMALAFFALPLVFIYFELTALRQALTEESDLFEQAALISSLRTLKDRQNLLGLCQDTLTLGLERAAAGITTLEEVLRVTQVDYADVPV